MSRTVASVEMQRRVSGRSLLTTDRSPEGTPPGNEGRIFTRGTGSTAGSKDANFARSFHRAQNLYQQVRRTFDPGHNVAPGASRSTFYMPEPALPPLDPSRYQAVVSAAIEATRGRSYQLPATTGRDVYTWL